MSTNKKRFNVYTICMVALLTAMMVLLSLTLSIRTPTFKLSFGSLPVVLGAMIFGPVEGALVAIFGEFLVQLLTYGLVPTTIIWIIPPAIRALVIGAVVLYLRRNGGTPLESRPVICYATCIIGAILTTTGNTFGMWLDSLFYGTSFTPVLFITPARYVSGVITAVVVTTACVPLMHMLRRSGVVKYTD